MKKGAAVVWIMALMLISTGIMLSPISSQASDLIDHSRHCNSNRWSGDKVTSVRINTVSGDVVMFDVNLAVAKAHHPGPGFVLMSVVPYDRYGNNLARSWTSARVALYGSPSTSTVSTLKSGHSISEAVHLLVSVEGVSPKGGFKFCDIFNYANGAWISAGPPTTPPPPGQPMQPTGQQPRIVGIAMWKKQTQPERIFTYFDNGRFNVLEANLWDPLKIRKRVIIKSEWYYLPSGKSPHDIVGMAMSPSDRLYVWFNDNTFSSGTPNRLGSTLMHYDLPNGKTPWDIVGIAMDPDWKQKDRAGGKYNENDNLVHVWFKDGSTCLGRPNNLGAYRPHDNYRPRLSDPLDVNGMAINWRGDVYTWYQDKVLIGKYPELNRFGAFNANALIPKRELIGGP